ncbi:MULTISPECIES: hypothetical protein, partial [Lactiplantibacillus]|uniref:hypothetical protein n=1 Tax=Lactiplantibacillus TaxID=2767842 RepID=UPI001C1FAC62
EYILNNVALLDITEDDQVTINFSHNNWLNAEMTTFIGNIIRTLQFHGFDVKASGMSDNISKFLSKNGFLKNFGIGVKTPDTYNTTIPFIELETGQTKTIDTYLNTKVFQMMDRQITTSQNEIIKSAIFELAHNVLEHSKSRYFCMCGQFFPNKKLLSFSIADYGESIPYHIYKQSSLMFNSDYDFINWATMEGTSTKSRIGGLGLYDIKNTIKTLGDFKILSGYGLVEYNYGCEPHMEELRSKFHGTMINLNYNLDRISNLQPDDTDDLLIF